MATESAVTHILALRHGQTDWNVAQRIQGHIDIPLNATGEAQARALAQQLRQQSIEAIYSSDLTRTLQTATPLGELHKLPVQHDAGLRERHFGRLEGMTYFEIEQQLPEQHARWRARDPHDKGHGGESLAEFSARIAQSLHRLASSHPNQTIALVSHGGVMDVIYRLATQTPLEAPRTWSISNAVVNRLTWQNGQLSLTEWGERRHLETLET